MGTSNDVDAADRNDSTGSTVAELTDALRSMASVGVRVGVRRISPLDAELLKPAEHDLTDGMADVRRAEFASGRALLHDLVAATDPIMRSPNGAPIFAPGTVGSLSHDRHWAIAAVAKQDRVEAIGVDFEAFGNELTLDEAAMILRTDDAAPEPLAAFVMKEATYKAWSAMGGPILDHHDVRVECVADSFSATVLGTRDSQAARSFVGQLHRSAGHWLALVVVQNDRFGDPQENPRLHLPSVE